MSFKNFEYHSGDGILPDNIDAVVQEQDTSLLLGQAPVIKTPVETFPVLVEKMKRQSPVVPGEVMVIHSKPKRFVAIVYDIEKKDICRREWIETALKNILHQCSLYQIRTLVMPLLGVAHGKIDRKVSMEILESVLANHQPECLESLYLITE